MTEESKIMLVDAMTVLFNNMDGVKGGKADPRFPALKIIEENWDDVIYEDFWKFIVETSNVDVQSRALLLLLKKRGVRAYGRIFRYIESGKIWDPEMVATGFAESVFNHFNGKKVDENVNYDIKVLGKSFMREGSKIYVLLKPMVETLLDLSGGIIHDPELSERYSEIRLRIVEFIDNLIDGMSEDMIPKVVSYFTASAKSTRFTRFMLSDVTLPPKLSAMFMLKRRTSIIKVLSSDYLLDTGMYHPVAAFVLRSLVSFNEIERYNAANILKDVDDGFYKSGDIINELLYAPHTEEFTPTIQLLEDTSLSFQVVLSLLKLSKPWMDITDDDLMTIIQKLNFNLHMRNLSTSIKKLDYLKNIERIEDIRPAELSESEIKFLEKLQREKLITRYYEKYEGGDAESFINIHPDAPEDIAEVLMLMDKKTVIKLEEISYLRYLLDSEEFTYTSMVEKRSELDLLPNLDQLFQFLRHRRNMYGTKASSSITIGSKTMNYKEKTYDLLAFTALFIPIILVRFIRIERNSKILEVILRPLISSSLLKKFPKHLTFSLSKASLLALERDNTGGVESRLISIFFRTVDRLPRESLKIIRNKLENQKQIPIFGGLLFYVRYQLGDPDLDYEGVYTFRNLELTARMATTLLDLVIMGHQKFEDKFIELFMIHKKYGVRLIPLIVPHIKENIERIPNRIKARFEKDVTMRLLFRSQDQMKKNNNKKSKPI